MEQKHHNRSFFIIAMGLRTVALLCVTGPIMQTFLASIGFSSQMPIYVSSIFLRIMKNFSSFLVHFATFPLLFLP